MRKPVLTLLIALCVVLGASFAEAPRALAAPDVSVDIRLFYDALAPYGRWIHRPAHGGWAWVPRGVPVNWRPYTHGHWVLTVEYGWYWVSDWEWGWAPFHYGRWVYDDEYGWMWIPDTVWGPAWVVWRFGDGWVGWAPLPTIVAWRPGVGLSLSVVEIERHVVPTHWVFCRDRDFAARDMDRHVELPARNVTLLPRTANATRYEIDRDRVVDRSLDVARIEKAVGRPLPRLRVREVSAPAAHGPAARGDEIDVYRPRIVKAAPEVRPPQPAPRAVEPPQQLRQQEETQRRQLLEQQQTERQRLEEHYRRQLETPTPAPRREVIRRQEQTEMRVLGEEHRREQQLLERRQQLERQPPSGRDGRPFKHGDNPRDNR